MSRGLCREGGHVWSSGLAATRCVDCGKRLVPWWRRLWWSVLDWRAGRA